MTHLGLFEGMGGFALAARWMGWETLAWCEINPFLQTVLHYHFPEASGYGDIKKTDFSIYADRVDVLTGGFPCQPYSLAGLRKGKADERHLWPQMLRAIREIRPRWIVGENVYGIVNWNGGLVFDEVLADLEAAGYEALPVLLPAAGVGAPHKRDRVFFIAHARHHHAGRASGLHAGAGGSQGIQERNEVQLPGEPGAVRHGVPPYPSGGRREGAQPEYTGVRGQAQNGQGAGQADTAARPGAAGDAAHADGQGLQGGKIDRADRGQRPHGGQNAVGPLRSAWDHFPTQSPVCARNDGFFPGVDRRALPRSWRRQTIMAAGNAVVPQLVIPIYKTIAAYEVLYYSKE